MPSYQKKKKNKVDKCNICGCEGNLTWDHVPPKSCFNDGKVQFNEYLSGLPHDGSYEKEYQSGFRFRTICEVCNNSLLGARYDVALNDFVHRIDRYLKSPLVLPVQFVLEVEVNKIARAICGHLLAADDIFGDVQIDIELRKFFLDEKALPPSDMQLFIRIYPYSTVVLVKDVLPQIVMPHKIDTGRPSGMLWVLSCYPIAYILSHSNEQKKTGMLDLFSFCTKEISDQRKIKINRNSCYYPNTSRHRHFLWPCNVSDEIDGVDFMLASEERPPLIGQKRK